MKCPNCNILILPKSQFCKHCGIEIAPFKNSKKQEEYKSHNNYNPPPSNIAQNNKGIKKSVLGVVGFILVFVVGNFVLVGAQSLWHSGDQAKLDNLKQELQTKKSVIDNLESQISAEKATMNQDQANGDIDAYNAKVDDYNSKLTVNQTDIDDYNNIVQQANDLSEKIGGTWYIVPIPVGHRE